MAAAHRYTGGNRRLFGRGRQAPGDNLMTAVLLALSILAPAPKPPEPRVATVTLSMAGTERKLAGALGTQWQGIGLALLGSSSVMAEATAADWEAAEKGDHIRIRFPKPHAVRAHGEDKDRQYDVSEFLIEMDGWSLRRPYIRCGDKVYRFAKYDGALWITLGRQFLPIE